MFFGSTPKFFGGVGGSSRSWYRSLLLKLNGVSPSLIHNYQANRYYSSSTGSSAFPFANTRTSNATMYNSAGNLVWAPANMIVRSGVTGATVGVIGSGGATPTGWTAISTTGITREIVSVGPNYVDVRWFGTNASGSTVFPHLYLDALTTAVNGAKYTLSANISVVGGSTTGWDSSNGRIELQYFLTGAYNSQATASTSPTATDTRYSVNATFPAAGVANQWRPAIRMGLLGSATVDLTLRIHSPQLEYTGVDSPKSYNPTNGTAYYGPRFDYNPSTLTERGVLIEGQITNEITRSDASTGVVGTPGTAPTGWSIALGLSNGVTRSVVGVGTANGLSYIDVRIVGTFTTAENITISPSPGPLTTTASTGQIWTGSMWWGVTAGTLPATFVAGLAGVRVRYGNPGILQQTTSNETSKPFSITTRTYHTATAPATTTVVGSDWVWTFNMLDTVDFTVRIAGGQLELASGSTSLIPTFGAAATRIQDSLSMSFSGYNATGGVLYAKYDLPEMSTTSFPPILLLSDGTSSNRLHISNVISSATTAQGIMHSVSGGVNDVNTGLPPSVSTLDMKVAFRYKLNDYYGTTNGGAGAVDTTGTPPVGVNALAVGQASPGTISLSRWVKEIRYYPDSSASNAQLQTLTTT